ncbi:hypothetical protein ACPV30_04100 [Photobacterium damselae]|nr:hypothetical protein [Photobacterium damselae]
MKKSTGDKEEMPMELQAQWIVHSYCNQVSVTFITKCACRHCAF